MTDLLPCPFCGGTDTIILNGPVEDDWCAVSCEKCHARGPIDYTDPHAIAAWNRRALLAQITPAVKVKPLVWENVGRCIGWKMSDETTHLHVAAGAGVNYEVAMGKPGWWAKWRGDYRAAALQTADAAKAAAQADYEARILSALDMTPAPTLADALEVPEVKALVEALDALAGSSDCVDACPCFRKARNKARALLAQIKPALVVEQNKSLTDGIREAIRLAEQPHYGDTVTALDHCGEAVEVLRSLLKKQSG